MIARIRSILFDLAIGRICRRLNFGASFSFLFILFSATGAAQTGRKVTLSDNSDWWSSNRRRDAGYTVKTQERMPADTNFQILDVDLTREVFTSAASKMGIATLVDRDATTGYRRTQACYTSVNDSPRVHLVFESASFPMGPGFYLFSDGDNWIGSDLCLSSKLVSINLSTGSGLHLGQSRSEVITILGKPSRQRKNEVVYAFHSRKRRSAEELKNLRDANPNLSDGDLHDKFDIYDLETSVYARFVDSKLTYLAVSKAELN